MIDHRDLMKKAFDIILVKDFKDIDIKIKLLIPKDDATSRCEVKDNHNHSIIVDRLERDKRYPELDKHREAFLRWCPKNILDKIDTVLHEVGHSYTYHLTDYDLGLFQPLYDTIFCTFIDLIKRLSDNPIYINDNINNLYRLKMNEVLADLYAFSRMPYIINKIAEDVSEYIWSKCTYQNKYIY